MYGTSDESDTDEVEADYDSIKSPGSSQIVIDVSPLKA